MSEQLIRRLVLKQQLLEFEVSKAFRQVHNASISLQQVTNLKNKTKDNWKFMLSKAVNASKNPLTQEGRQVLADSLKGLKKINSELQLLKVSQKERGLTLNAAISKVVVSKKKLENCESKKKDLIGHKLYIKTEADAEVLISQKLTAATDRRDPVDSNLSENVSVDKYELNCEAPMKITDMTFLQILPEVGRTPRSPELIQSLHSDDISERKNHLWEKAESNRQLSESYNSNIKVTLADSGSRLEIDYLVKPGHLISVDAHKASDCDITDIQITAANEEDRQILSDSIEKSELARIKVI